MLRAQEESQGLDIKESSMPMFCDFEEENSMNGKEKKGKK